MKNQQTLNHYSKSRKLSENKLKILTNRYNSNALSEGAQKSTLARSIVHEAILYERLTILEALTNMSQDELHKNFFKSSALIMMFADNLNCGGLGNLNNQLQSNAEDMLMLGQADSKSMKIFMNKLSDMIVIIKGLTALGDVINEDYGSKKFSEASSLSSASTISDLIKSAKSTKGWENKNLGVILDEFNLGEEELGAFTKRSRFFGGKKSSVSKKEIFSNEVKNLLKSKVPGFMKVVGESIVNELINRMLSTSIPFLQDTFQDFLNESTDVLSNRDLLKMAEPGVMGTLKNIAGFFSGGSRSARI